MLLSQMSAKKNRVSRFLELALPNYPTSYKMLHPWTKSVKKVLCTESKTSVYQSKANLKKSDFKAKSTFAHVNLQKTFSTKLSINVKWSVRRVSPSGGLISSLLTRCSILHSIYFVLKFMITLTVILFGNLIQLLQLTSSALHQQKLIKTTKQDNHYANHGFCSKLEQQVQQLLLKHLTVIH